VIDRDAAGRGWFVDSTPGANEEFTAQGAGVKLKANESSPAYGQMDLITAVSHELGHVLGLPHARGANDLMSSTLDTGVRLLTTSFAAGDPLDVNGDGKASPIDALMIINHLNAAGAALAASSSLAEDLLMDISGDGHVSAIDALLIINYLNSQSSSDQAVDADINESAASDGNTDTLLYLLASDVSTQGGRRK
jgi:hypothetical protein